MLQRRLKHRVNRWRLKALAARQPDGVGKFTLAGVSGRSIALSFDDGPSRENTPELLELLAAYDAKATFFAVGTNVVEHQQLAREVVTQGHELANHTWSHADPKTLTDEELRVELERAAQVIHDATGVRPTSARPPWGNDRRRFARLAREAGMESIMWNIDSGDTAGLSAEAQARMVIADARPGAIILFHDGGDRRPTTLAATEQVLRELTARDFEFVTVSSALTAPEA